MRSGFFLSTWRSVIRTKKKKGSDIVGYKICLYISAILIFFLQVNQKAVRLVVYYIKVVENLKAVYNERGGSAEPTENLKTTCTNRDEPAEKIIRSNLC